MGTSGKRLCGFFRRWIESKNSGWNSSGEKDFQGFSERVVVTVVCYLPKFCEVDVSRYRNGILEFVRERLGQERFIMPATQIELMPGGLRFHQNGRACTAKIKEKVLVFHTPKMTSWILNQAKKTGSDSPSFLRGESLWEQWSLVSRDNLDPEVIGTFSKSRGLGGSRRFSFECGIFKSAFGFARWEARSRGSPSAERAFDE